MIRVLIKKIGNNVVNASEIQLLNACHCLKQYPGDFPIERLLNRALSSQRTLQ